MNEPLSLRERGRGEGSNLVQDSNPHPALRATFSRWEKGKAKSFGFTYTRRFTDTTGTPP